MIVVKGFSQIKGINYHKIFSHVVKHLSIKLMVSIIALFDLELEQKDVTIVFLNENLDEQICMEKPKGFVKREIEMKFVCCTSLSMV